MEAGPSYTVLRIKRKATEPPLSSLVIKNDPSHPSTGFGTPKKRRDVSYRPRGVFKLADTVPDSWIGRGQEGEVLKERIRGLMVDPEEPSLSSEAKGKGKGKEVDKGPGPQQKVEVPEVPKRAVTPPRTPQTPQSGGMQYRVINPLSTSTPKRPRGAHGLPPPVLSYAEVEAQARSPFRFIDAQAIDRSSKLTGMTQSKQAAQEEKDPQMAAFEDMLEEYLTLERSEASRKEAEEEYVYDLYYRDVRDASLALGMRAGDGMSGNSIGALIGFDDLSPPSSPSSSEPEDEADEDSNDEDFYRNDYPEDEDADSDMEGFDDAFASDSEEGSGSESGGSDGEKGKWDYR